MTSEPRATSRRADALFGRAAWIVLALLSFSKPVLAQEDNQAAARELFREGRALADAGNFEAACPKLEAASKLYVSAGTILSLGDCYEHLGHTASAWTDFGQALSVAQRTSRQDAAAEAQRRQAALEPKLSRLLIRAPGGIAGLVVKRDGSELAAAAWGSAIPVDPGAHQVVAQAPGRVPWSSQVSVEGAGQTTTVDIPDLAVLVAASAPVEGSQPAPAMAPLDTPAPSAAGHRRRTVGWVLGAAGVVAMGVGGILGLVAKSQFDAADGETGPARKTDSSGAVGTGNAATVVVCAGAALTAAGVVLWLTAPRAPASVGTNGRELFVRAAF
jgi:hypothetical protein